MADYHYRQLTDIQKKIYQSLFEAIGRRENSFYADSGDIDEVSRVFEALSFDRPELFFVDFARVNLTVFSPARSLAAITYLYPREEITRRTKMLEKEIGRLLSGIDRKRLSPLEKCRAIHDRLVRNVMFCEAARGRTELYPRSVTAEGALLDRSAVCEGVARAACLMGQRMETDLPVVTGDASSDGGTYEPHAWNLFFDGEKSAHLDVTWDICLSAPQRFTRYDYFCLPDIDMKKDHRFSGLPRCRVGCGLTFFEKSLREFFDPVSARNYVMDRIFDHAGVIYFKFDDPTVPAAVTARRLDELVRGALSQLPQPPLSFETAHNLAQSVFFYRLNGQGACHIYSKK